MKHYYNKQLFWFLNLLLLLAISPNTIAQCTVNVYGEWGNLLPQCGTNNWYSTGNGWLGEYSLVNVVQGNTYEFQTYRNNNAQTSRYATITTITNQVLTFGTTNPGTSVTWIATFTGQVRFWSHTNAGCGTGTQNTVRRVRCSEPPCAAPSEAGILAADKLETVDNDAVSWVVSGGDPIIRYEYNFNGGNWIELLNTNPALELVVFTNGGFFEMRSVHQFNNCPISYSNIVTTSFNCAPYFQYGPTDGDFITNVSINTLNNTSSSDFGDGLSPIALDGYQNFASLTTDLTIGQEYELTVSGTTTFGASQGFAAWIDWNNDGIYDNSENVLLASPTPFATAIITIPPSALAGPVKMRVLCSWNSTPTTNACDASNYLWGEIEEYTLNLTDPSTLPVTLTYFQAECVDDYIQLNWQTESESNSSHFLVESSRDGITWATSPPIPATGYSSVQQDYSFLDLTSGIEYIGYYRLRQIDFNGQEEVFGPISVECKNFSSDQLSVFPNPSNGEFSVRIESLTGSDNASILIINSHGKVVDLETVLIEPGVTSFIGKQKVLDPGIYYVQIISPELKIAPQKLIIH